MADVMASRGRGVFEARAMEQEGDDVAQGRHHLRPRPLADSSGILAERPVAHAVRAILDACSVTVSYPGPVNMATVGNSATIAVSAVGNGAVAMAWLLLAVGGHRRSGAHRLDRPGRVLGASWIA